jgi:hypothetical protein
MPEKRYLMIPSPRPVSAEVLAALAERAGIS